MPPSELSKVTRKGGGRGRPPPSAVDTQARQEGGITLQPPAFHCMTYGQCDPGPLRSSSGKTRPGTSDNQTAGPTQKVATSRGTWVCNGRGRANHATSRTHTARRMTRACRGTRAHSRTVLWWARVARMPVSPTWTCSARRRQGRRRVSWYPCQGEWRRKPAGGMNHTRQKSVPHTYNTRPMGDGQDVQCAVNNDKAPHTWGRLNNAYPAHDR